MRRRTFLGMGTSCAAHLLAWSALAPAGRRALFAARSAHDTVAQEVWGRIERVAENVWALISTPLAGGEKAMRTLSNGGIIAGREGVVVVEGFASDEGASWMAEAARELTGRAPSHVVLTHYHGDHSGGLAAYAQSGTAPSYVTTDATFARLQESAERQARWEPVVEALEAAERVDSAPLSIDSGTTEVIVTPRTGHTASDLTVTVTDPRIVFCGDLLWNGMVPNYRDARPLALSQSVRGMLDDPDATFVPGHGSIPDEAELRDYVRLLDDLEETARRAFAAGTPAAEAAASYRPPAGLAEWTLFNEAYFRVALEAWERDLQQE